MTWPANDEPGRRPGARRYLVLHGLRWLPTGFLVPVLILLMLERGLTLAQAGLVSAVTGVTVLVQELLLVLRPKPSRHEGLRQRRVRARARVQWHL